MKSRKILDDFEQSVVQTIINVPHEMVHSLYKYMNERIHEFITLDGAKTSYLCM